MIFHFCFYFFIRPFFFSSCTGIGDDGLAALSSGCKKLKQLNLSYCNEVTDRGLQYLSQVEELSDLELRGLVNITDKGLTALAAGCKRLSALDLKHCENINDSGFWSLAYYSRSLLQVSFYLFQLDFLFIHLECMLSPMGTQMPKYTAF